MAARVMSLRGEKRTVQILCEQAEAVADAAAIDEPVGFYHNDFLFHRHLIRHCGNPYIARWGNAEALILNSFINLPQLDDLPPHTWQEADWSLESIAECIEAKDPDGAETAARMHICRTKSRLLRWMNGADRSRYSEGERLVETRGDDRLPASLHP
jgi:DNA-binding FadR family transcriptional regulator